MLLMQVFLSMELVMAHKSINQPKGALLLLGFTSGGVLRFSHQQIACRLQWPLLLAPLIYGTGGGSKWELSFSFSLILYSDFFKIAKIYPHYTEQHMETTYSNTFQNTATQRNPQHRAKQINTTQQHNSQQ